jgi:hypothetical protein
LVEEVKEAEVVAIYAYGTAGVWNVDRPGWARVKGEFVDGALKLVLPRPATVIYRMQPDGTLDARYEWRGGIARAKMTRVRE